MGVFDIFKKKVVAANAIPSKKFYVPKEHRKELYRLISRHEKVGSSTTKFALWIGIDKMFPDIDITNGEWSIDIRDVLRPYLRGGSGD